MGGAPLTPLTPTVADAPTSELPIAGINSAARTVTPATTISTATRVAQVQAAVPGNGPKYARLDIQWGAVETQKGSYDFSASDAIVTAFEQAGITPIIIGDYGNVLYQDDGNSYKTFPTTAAAVTGFANYFAAMVQHYGTLPVWEVYNEPNQNPPAGVALGAPVAPSYATLLSATLHAIRNVAPTATVVTGGAGTADPSGFISAVLSSMTAADLQSLNGIGLHPYGGFDKYNIPAEWSNANLIDPFRLAVSNAYASVSGAGLPPPIDSTEDGVSLSWVRNLSLTRHGLAVARQYLAIALEHLPMYINYSSQDIGTDPSNPENLFGLYDVNGNAKPALTAYAAAISATQGFSTWSAYQNPSLGAYLIALRGSIKTRDIVWTSATALSMTVPGAFSTGVDLYGNAVPIVSNGFSTTIPLTEAGGPVILN